MTSKSSPARSVDAQGVALGEFDRVSFSASVTEKGSTAVEAKQRLEPAVRELDAYIQNEVAERFGLDRKTLVNTISVDAAYDYDRSAGQNVHAGYSATYRVTFQTIDVDSASQVFDGLTNFNKVEASAPKFLLSNVEELLEKAAEDSYNKAMARFKSECKILGKNPEDYYCSSWSYRYDESKSAGPQPMRAMAASLSMEAAGGGDFNSAPAASLKPGEAKVYAYGNFSFHKSQL